MTNLELMLIAKNVGINHKQKQWLYYLGGIIVVGAVTTFVLIKQNKTLKATISAARAENDKFCLQEDNNKSIITKLQKQIADLENGAQDFQRMIVTLENKPNTNIPKA